MRRILVFVLVFFIIVPSFAYADSVQTGSFKYTPAFEEEAEEVYYYSDDYFNESGKTYNEHLMAMSYDLALSTFEEGGHSYTDALLRELGFKGLEAMDLDGKPTADTVGTVIAHKKIGNKNLVAVAIRGQNYESEWANNFIAGKTGNAKGFNDSAIKVIERLKDYIKEKDLDDVQIWMVGFSRGGAVADLAGAHINKNLDKFNVTEDDLFVYTFEAPASSTDDATYDNIYNIKSINDLIPNVYPKEWGFRTCGKEIIIGEPESIQTYIGLEEETEYGEVELNEFYDQLFSWLTSRLDRSTYAEHLEEPISKVLTIYFDKSPEEREKLKNFLLEDVKGAVLDNEENFNRIKPTVWSVLGHESDYLYQKIVSDLIDIVDSVRNTPNGSALTDEEYGAIKNMLYPVLRVLGPIVVDDTNYFDGVDYDEFYTSFAVDYYLSDQAMGKKYGEYFGKDYGYDDGFYGNPKEENSFEIFDDYGPAYDAAYKEAYSIAYLEYYELGKLHSEDLALRGKYDGRKYSYETGYYDGSHGEPSDSKDEYFYREDWMTEEYITAYDATYEEEYLRGYEEGLKNPGTEEEESQDLMSLYHFRTLIKNIKDIIKHHYPQNILPLIQKMDSYYTQGVPREDKNEDGDDATKQEDEAKDQGGKSSDENAASQNDTNRQNASGQNSTNRQNASDQESGTSKNSATPKTGDESNAVLWICILITSSIGVKRILYSKQE